MNLQIILIVFIGILFNTSCSEKPGDYLITRTNYENDLDRLYQKKVISDIEYLTYLYMGPQLLFINADEKGVTLENLKLTGYKPDSIRYQPIKCIDSICLDINVNGIVDSFILITVLINNHSTDTVSILNFEIADVLGSEVINIWHYDLRNESNYIEPGASVILLNDFVPIVYELFDKKFINSKFEEPLNFYKYINQIVWNFNYQLKD